MRRVRENELKAWLRDELVLVLVLGGAFAVFGATHVRNAYRLPDTYLALNTTVALACASVAVLAAIRFSVESRRSDLLLSCGFFVVALSTLAFEVAPLLRGHPLHRSDAWGGTAGRVLASLLIACAAFAHGRTTGRARRLLPAFVLSVAVLLGLWLVVRWLGHDLPATAPADGRARPPLLTAAVTVQALLSLLALIGFGQRFRVDRDDLDRWLALGSTLLVFAQLGYVATPLVSSDDVSQADFLRLLSYGVLLVGVWRAIRAAEFGRAVAEERARVAREIHDGLAQYLFAISTQVSMLEYGGAPAEILPRLRDAAAAAQQEARFAVLALSSASGHAPFDAALRRYVEFLTADGALEVEVDIDYDVRLGPDEQIELFRVVQEGLANVRKHSGARHASVRIGLDAGRRRVTIADDGRGFAPESANGGQGLLNIRDRVGSIGGAFRLSSLPGSGTSLEVTLRA
jgi:signal transduction histidine kinase